MNTARKQNAFTLIELLVVIAIIALLISILLPSLSSARGMARQLVGSAIQKNLGVAQMAYMNTFKEYYAGRNTSGAWYAGITVGSGPNFFAPMYGDHNSNTPTTTYDWISPSLGDGVEFSPNRAQRTQQIFNTYRDPSARNDMVIWSGSSPGDINDFRAAFGAGPFKQTSFLQPTGFQLVHPLALPTLNSPGLAGLQYNYAGNFTTPITQPVSFRPRLDKVGIQLSGKALIMDGTRYYSAALGLLDFDSSTNGLYSSFADPGPIYDGSAAYGRSSGEAGGLGWKFSFRHPSSSMNVTFFDGHTASMKSDTAYREPKYFYPSGSVVSSGGQGTPELEAKYPDGTIID